LSSKLIFEILKKNIGKEYFQTFVLQKTEDRDLLVKSVVEGLKLGEGKAIFDILENPSKFMEFSGIADSKSKNLIKKFQDDVFKGITKSIAEGNLSKDLGDLLSIKRYSGKTKQAILTGAKLVKPETLSVFFKNKREEDANIKKLTPDILFNFLTSKSTDEIKTFLTSEDTPQYIKQQSVDLLLSKRKLKGKVKEVILNTAGVLMNTTSKGNGIKFPLKKLSSVFGKTGIRSKEMLDIFSGSSNTKEYVEFINDKKALNFKEIETLLDNIKNESGFLKNKKAVFAIVNILTKKKGIGGRNTPIKKLKPEEQDKIKDFFIERSDYFTPEIEGLFAKPNAGGVITRTTLENRRNVIANANSSRDGNSSGVGISSSQGTNQSNTIVAPVKNNENGILNNDK
jgi:hypothetical protein